jgi:glycine oxidase
MIAIIGGGICGLAIGWRLRQAGVEATIFERGEAGMEGSWAAAGMLAPRSEAEHAEEALLPLALESLGMWRGFAAELEAETGIDVDYRDHGTMIVAIDRDDREQLEHRFEYFRSLDLDVEWLSGYAARQREPHLARAVTGAIMSATDHQVDNRKASKALKAAFLQAGGTLHEHLEVDEIVVSGGRVTGVRAGNEEIAADAVVLAAGAWSRNIPGLPDKARPPVRPLKGQMIEVAMDPDAPLIERVIWGPAKGIAPLVYFAPKAGGRLIIGCTVEEMGFSTDLTAGGMFEILRAAWDVLPGIYDLRLVDSWIATGEPRRCPDPRSRGDRGAHSCDGPSSQRHSAGADHRTVDRRLHSHG